MTPETKNTSHETPWTMLGLTVICLRFVQGFIFWGGGSRRFIYDPAKLNPNASEWMANKLQSAMPGALLDFNHLIGFLLQHFVLLYTAIILYSLVELMCGIALLLGFFTRSAGFVSAMVSVMLMLIFGWQGSTCLDEWTMAVCNVAMGLTLALSGSAVFSVDGWLMHRYPFLSRRRWFVMCASGPVRVKKFKIASVVFFIFTAAFTLGTYNYYRGALLSRYHAGPVSPSVHHITLSHGSVTAKGVVTFEMYVDAGTPAVPGHIIRIELMDSAGKVVEAWEGETLSQLTPKQFANVYRYNRIAPGVYGLVAPVSADATVTLQPMDAQLALARGEYQLQVYTINGHRFDLAVKLA